MDIINVLNRFNLKDCYTIGSKADIKRIHTMIQSCDSNMNFKIAFGDVLEDSVFDKCMTSLTIPSMSKVTAILNYEDYRVYDQFSLIQSFTIEDMMIRDIQQLTLIKENLKNGAIYISDMNTVDKVKKNVTVDYLYFAYRLEAISNMYQEVSKKLDKKENHDYLQIMNSVLEVGVSTIDSKKILTFRR